jgi:hypothetical protein
MALSKEVEDWLKWRDRERAKHRVMTVAEWEAWCRGGDAISHPSSASCFPGGLTILFGDGIIGKTIP